MEAVGADNTLTVIVAAEVQPLALSYPVTVYVVVVNGVAKTTAPVVVDKPVAGDQVKASALVALMAMVPPLHTATDGPTYTCSIG